MTYVIGEACIGTKETSCVDVCPVDCIHDAGELYVIDPIECIDCGACEPACPVQAISPASAVPAAERAFIEINASWLEGRDAVARELAAWRAEQGG